MSIDHVVISMNSLSILFSSSFVSNSTLNLPRKVHQSFKPLDRSIPIRCSNDKSPNPSLEDRADDAGVKLALSVLNLYKREISPVLPKSCRYVPTCSEYSMIAYKKYGFVKGSLLTAWRICRCNPFGGSGFDPPRWFDEESPPEILSSTGNSVEFAPGIFK